MAFKKKHQVVVFLPAHNEEESIGKVISRIPRQINSNKYGTLDVKIVVVDDGSRDKTVQVAQKAGADSIFSFSKNRGLGAAVREGLRQSYILGATVSVMIDADNEYPAEQIPELVIPIIEEDVDYTMGSRFLGTIKGMKLHRRLGNYCFTLLQSILLRTWIYDGQSGMRAFSREAMEHAEIIHDYNYAQVITLNLLRKGFRMKEIPIRYHVRTKGQSFIKFYKYMFNVIPAIFKEMKRPVERVKNYKGCTSQNGKTVKQANGI